MALWGKTSADADKPKWLTAAQKADTELTDAGWVYTQVDGTKEILVAMGDAEVTPPGPVNTVLPAITGTARVAQALTVNNGTWVGTAPSYARVWQTADASTGPWTDTATTTTTYTPGAGAVGDYIRVKLTATRDGGSTVVYSNVAGPVIAA